MVDLKLIRMSDLESKNSSFPDPKSAQPLTLNEIMTIEPRIADILDNLKPCGRRNQKWFNEYLKTKNQLVELVGWGAEQYDLRTSQAYDVVLDTVINKLDSSRSLKKARRLK